MKKILIFTVSVMLLMGFSYAQSITVTLVKGSPKFLKLILPLEYNKKGEPKLWRCGEWKWIRWEASGFGKNARVSLLLVHPDNHRWLFVKGLPIDFWGKMFQWKVGYYGETLCRLGKGKHWEMKIRIEIYQGEKRVAQRDSERFPIYCQ